MTKKPVNHRAKATFGQTLSPTKSYMTYIDIMRLIACVAVIIIHVTATPVMTLIHGSYQQLFFIVINRLAKPSVPLFIFISGYLAYPFWQGPLTSFYYKKAMRLLLPYIVWTFLYQLLYFMMGIYPMSLRFFLDHLIKGDMMYHLYFMLILIQLTLFTPLWRFIAHHFSMKGLLIFALIIQLGSIGLHLPFQDRLWSTYILYYVLGMMLRAYPDKTHKGVATGMTMALGGLYCYQFYQSINYQISVSQVSASLLYITFSVASCYAVFHFSQGLATRLNHNRSSTLKRWGNSTEWLYYAHPVGILSGTYAMRYLPFESIIFESVLSLFFILFFIVPFAYFAPQIKSTLQLLLVPSRQKT
jgi:surface polysaccharide O-acyltransferase-like enzyme